MYKSVLRAWLPWMFRHVGMNIVSHHRFIWVSRKHECDNTATNQCHYAQQLFKQDALCVTRACQPRQNKPSVCLDTALTVDDIRYCNLVVVCISFSKRLSASASKHIHRM